MELTEPIYAYDSLAIVSENGAWNIKREIGTDLPNT